MCIPICQNYFKIFHEPRSEFSIFSKEAYFFYKSQSNLSNLFPLSGHNPSKAIPELQASLRKAGWQKQRSITVIEEVSA
jgi:hypothetical protein